LKSKVEKITIIEMRTYRYVIVNPSIVPLKNVDLIIFFNFALIFFWRKLLKDARIAKMMMKTKNKAIIIK
jgi:hypothetical protein